MTKRWTLLKRLDLVLLADCLLINDPLRKISEGNLPRSNHHLSLKGYVRGFSEDTPPMSPSVFAEKVLNSVAKNKAGSLTSITKTSTKAGVTIIGSR